MLRPDEYFNLFVCGLCVVMSLGLLQKPINLRKILLACILLSLGYIQFVTVLISSRLIYHYPGFYYSSLPFGYSLSPLVYFYIRSFMQEAPGFKRRDLLHFIPALPLAGIFFNYLTLSQTDMILKIDMFYDGLSSFGLWICLNILVYTFYAVFIGKALIKVFHRENPLHRRLIRLFLLLFSWVILLSARVISMRWGIDLLWRIVDCVISLELLLFYFHLQRYPVLLSYAHMGNTVKKRSGPSILEGLDTHSLKRNIEIMMDEDRLFCDEDLNLSRFSHALEISSHQLSAFLNEHFGRNFNVFVNGYRIRYACELMTTDSRMSTLSISFACGFNSYSAFFTAFKKETGQSPRDYRNNSK